MTVGAFGRASESGLGCPDWPACHGRLLASGDHAMIEEFHRWFGLDGKSSDSARWGSPDVAEITR